MGSLREPQCRGVVLVMVLWVLLAMSLLALSFSASIRTEIDATRNVVDQKQSYYLARAGLEYALYKIMESQMAFAQAQQARDQFEFSFQVATGSLSLQLASGGADVEIIDETGKMNVNVAPGHLLYNLLIMIGVEPQEADVITDSIEDWRDPDDLYRPNGAESDYYQSLENSYLPRNGPLEVVEELLLVQGVTPEIYYGQKGVTDTGERVEYYGLQKYLTTFTRTPQINVNSAPLPVLAAIPGLDYDKAVEIHNLTSAGPILNTGEIAQRIPGISTEVLRYLSALRSPIYTLVSDGRLRGSTVISRIRAVVQIGTGQKGYAVLYWNEANLEL